MHFLGLYDSQKLDKPIFLLKAHNYFFLSALFSPQIRNGQPQLRVRTKRDNTGGLESQKKALGAPRLSYHYLSGAFLNLAQRNANRAAQAKLDIPRTTLELRLVLP